MFVGQVSVAPSGTKTGTEPVWMGGAVQRQPAWLMPQQIDALLQLIQQRLVDVSWQEMRNVALVTRHFLHQ